MITLYASRKGRMLGPNTVSALFTLTGRTSRYLRQLPSVIDIYRK